jgi:2-methylisocitrate lyase-like PEP mutase family enzyme
VTDASSQSERAAAFRALHAEGTFVLANAWDAASAKVIERAGAPAIATTSSGASWSLGVPDGEALTAEEMLALVARVAGAVSVPVTADVESGYGPGTDAAARTVAGAVAAGAVGVNLEDRDRGGPEPLWPISAQVERLAAARAAADASGVSVLINARTDVYLAAVGDEGGRLDHVLKRARAYADAGAECLFVPAMPDLEVTAAVVAGSPIPVNVLLGQNATAASIADLAGIGVRRVSVGSLLATAALGELSAAATALLAGDASRAARGLTLAEMRELFPPRR